MAFLHLKCFSFKAINDETIDSTDWSPERYSNNSIHSKTRYLLDSLPTRIMTWLSCDFLLYFG